jgi:hypothetical protein
MKNLGLPGWLTAGPRSDTDTQQSNTARPSLRTKLSSALSHQINKAPRKATSPLLALPAELRLLIYGACLAPTGTLQFSSTATHHYALAPRISPALLATCRQIHAEAEQVLYERNTLCLITNAEKTNKPLIAEFQCPQHVLQKLRRICLIFDVALPFCALLKRLELEVITGHDERRGGTFRRRPPEGECRGARRHGRDVSEHAASGPRALAHAGAGPI